MDDTLRGDVRFPVSWAAAFIFWGVYWLLYAAVRLGTNLWLDPEGKTLRNSSVVDHGLEFAVWALLTPLIVRLSWSLPVTRSNYLFRIPLHLAIGLGAILLSELVTLAPHNWVMHPPSEWHPFTVRVVAMEVILSGLHEDLISYLAILTAGFALRYHRTVQVQRLSAARLEVQLTESRLDALRRQLHPHFLFNTLNTISSLAQDNPKEARRVIARLGELLRRALESAEQEIPLREELRFARAYLDIVRARFGENLRIEIRANPELQDALVPTLVLQPLLENAVEHGIEPSVTDGWLQVEAAHEGDSLTLRVSDNGAGFGGQPIHEGVGIHNTRARLEQLYRSAARLSLFERVEGGVTVEITLPYRIVNPLGKPAGKHLALQSGE